MSDFWPQTLNNRFFEWMVFQRVSPALTKTSLTFTFNGQEPWHKFKTFLIKHIRIGHVIYCRDSEHFISLLQIIGGLFRAMAQMKASNFLDPHQNTYWILNQNVWSDRPKIWHSIFNIMFSITNLLSNELWRSVDSINHCRKCCFWEKGYKFSLKQWKTSLKPFFRHLKAVFFSFIILLLFWWPLESDFSQICNCMHLLVLYRTVFLFGI